ncbi:DUF2489 domain-containing protein [Shewanella carassii]|uniref:DUF2489 domain-containing protein n=2 Tax=Bacteria TaxID=2 RepID=A0ABQ1TAL7_9GAMM|nr:DUF2489 domain-containing protein [Shewanella carassii]BCV64684.1 hypothetical protein TUM17387_00430 [Shewanella carassii]GGE89268.1 hypothetical protein GCM10011520_32150 [Shewanella carassii]
MQFILISLAMLIIIGLSAYATVLLLRLRRQTQAREQTMAEQKAAMEAKQASLLADIRYIAAAMTEERCELSEGVVRIVKLFDLLSLTERVSGDYPDVFMHFERIKDHPILEARAKLPKQERMRLDLARMKSEAELEQGILADAKKLSEFQLKPTH